MRHGTLLGRAPLAGNHHTGKRAPKQLLQALQAGPQERKNVGQKMSLRPSWAAKGMPTVVPRPKKSPRAPAGARNRLRLVMGRVCVQAGSRQKAVAFERLLTGVGRAEMSATKLLPGFRRLKRLKNSAKGRSVKRSRKTMLRLTRRST